jgi:hypothetical protein
MLSQLKRYEENDERCHFSGRRKVNNVIYTLCILRISHTGYKTVFILKKKYYFENEAFIYYYSNNSNFFYFYNSWARYYVAFIQ